MHQSLFLSAAEETPRLDSSPCTHLGIREDKFIPKTLALNSWIALLNERRYLGGAEAKETVGAGFKETRPGGRLQSFLSPRLHF